MKHHAGVLTMLLSAVLGVSAVSSMPVSAVSDDEAAKRRESVEIFCSMCNDVRVAQGMQELYIAPVLVDYAQVRADELTTLFSHDRPDGSKCFSIMKNDNFFYNTAAENIAAGGVCAEDTFWQFMDSTGHRKNIMNESMTHIGIGYVHDDKAKPAPDMIDYGYYWSMFLIGTYDSHNTPVTFAGQYIPERDPGDADGSKVITAADASRVMQYSAARSAGATPQVTKQFLKASDVNGDGAVNAIDSQIILSYCSAHGTDPDAKLEDFVW
jgi:uncharacterized protein YkwD